jgi:hypothetical protein
MFGDHFAIIQTLTGAQADGAGRGEG